MLKVNLADDEHIKKDPGSKSSEEKLKSNESPIEKPSQPDEENFTKDILSEADTSAELDGLNIDEESVLPSEEITEEDFLGKPLGDDQLEGKPKVDKEVSMDDDTTIVFEKTNRPSAAGSEIETPEIIEKQETPTVKTEPKTKIEDDYYESDYDVGGGKKKWLFIGGGILIALLAVVYFVWNPFGGDTDAANAEPTVDPVQAQLLEKKKSDARLMAQVRGVYGGQIASIVNFVNQVPKSAKLSMVYFYGNEMKIEVFSKDRTAFAELRKNLKTAKLFDSYQLVNTRTLIPNADVLATFTSAPKPATMVPGDSAVFLNNSQIARQLDAFAGRENLKIKAQTAAAAASTNQNTRISRLAYTIRGQEINIINFLNAIKSSPMNVNIAKLSVAGISKNNINKREMSGTFELNLILPN